MKRNPALTRRTGAASRQEGGGGRGRDDLTLLLPRLCGVPLVAPGRSSRHRSGDGRAAPPSVRPPPLPRRAHVGEQLGERGGEAGSQMRATCLIFVAMVEVSPDLSSSRQGGARGWSELDFADGCSADKGRGGGGGDDADAVYVAAGRRVEG